MSKTIEMTAADRREWQRLYDAAWAVLDDCAVDGK